MRQGSKRSSWGLVFFWLLKHKCVSVWGICGSVVLLHVCRESLCLQSDRIVLGQQKGAAAFCVKCNSAVHRCRSEKRGGNILGEAYRSDRVVCLLECLAVSFFPAFSHTHKTSPSEQVMSSAQSFCGRELLACRCCFNRWSRVLGTAGVDDLILVLKISPSTLQCVWEAAFGGVYWFLNLGTIYNHFYSISMI